MLNPKHFLHDSFRYALLRNYLRFFHNAVFYRKIIIHNLPKFPPNTPLLIVTNHQNTLMDPLAVLFNMGSLQPIFLARADVFKNETLRTILTFLKILPVYRQHDNVENLQQENDVIFEKCIELLQQKRSLVIFPEGNHGMGYRLRPLKKGTARIALKAEANSQWDLGLKILPCGVHYTHCQRMNETLTLNFGEPIQIQDLKDLYETNQPKALTTLTQRIAATIKPLMLHIEDQVHHDEIVFLTEKERTDEPLFSAQKTVEKLKSLTTAEYETLMEDTKKERLLFEKNNLRAITLSKPKLSKTAAFARFTILAITFPIAAFGFLANVIPFSLPLLITRKLEDKQFTSAFRFVLYFAITFPIYYLLLFGILINFFSLFMTIVLLLLVALTGYFAHQWSAESTISPINP